MNKFKPSYFLTSICLCVAMVFSSFSACSKDDDDVFDSKKDEESLNSQTSYDILEINDVKYACYGYRAAITYKSEWDLETHSGYIGMPCQKLSDAQKGNLEYAYLWQFYLEGSSDLKKGSNLENFSPTLRYDIVGDYNLRYVSGSATIIDKNDEKMYITVKYNSFRFKNNYEDYTFNGTVQLFYEDYQL